MRKMEFSGNTRCATRLSSRAEARLRPNGFSTMTRARVGQIRGAQPRDHRLEERRRDGQVVRRAPATAQRRLDGREGVRVVIVAADVPEQRQQMAEGTLVRDPARPLDAVFHALAQLRETPLREGHAHDRDLQHASSCHRVERREDHLVGEVASRAEQHQGVGVGLRHDVSTGDSR